MTYSFKPSTPLQWTDNGQCHMATFSPAGRGRIWCESTEFGGHFITPKQATTWVTELIETHGAQFLKPKRKPVVRATRFRGWSGGRHIDMPCTFVKR